MLRRRCFLPGLFLLLEAREDQIAHLEQDLLIGNKDFQQVRLVKLREIRQLNLIFGQLDQLGQRVVHAITGYEAVIVLPVAV